MLSVITHKLINTWVYRYIVVFLVRGWIQMILIVCYYVCYYLDILPTATVTATATATPN